MSGPLDPQAAGATNRGIATIEVREGRTTKIGPMGILRILPTKNRRTIGPWCFTDLMLAEDVDQPPPLEIGPHPHIGLATVTWLFTGSALHTDSLGTEQLIRPGQLNLMTSGRGIAHAEQGLGSGATWSGSGTMGVQMWLAQPDATRHGGSRFQHLPELPVTEIGDSLITVFVGGLGDAVSPANVDHPTLGLDVALRGGTEIPTNPRFEHGVVPIDRPVKVGEEIVEPGSLAIVPEGWDLLRLETRSESARVMVLGGAPLGENVEMWWNFVARTKEEITAAWRDWDDRNVDRFGSVPTTLQRMEAPRPPWLGEGR
jgi:quercetin 2,3-dioxygenase